MAVIYNNGEYESIELDTETIISIPKYKDSYKNLEDKPILNNKELVGDVDLSIKDLNIRSGENISINKVGDDTYIAAANMEYYGGKGININNEQTVSLKPYELISSGDVVDTYHAFQIEFNKDSNNNTFKLSNFILMLNNIRSLDNTTGFINTSVEVSNQSSVPYSNVTVIDYGSMEYGGTGSDISYYITGDDKGIWLFDSYVVNSPNPMLCMKAEGGSTYNFNYISNITLNLMSDMSLSYSWRLVGIRV